jgi:hypothetical protein
MRSAYRSGDRWLCWSYRTPCCSHYTHSTQQHAQGRLEELTYCDEKVANREIRVWHFVIEKGY